MSRAAYVAFTTFQTEPSLRVSRRSSCETLVPGHTLSRCDCSGRSRQCTGIGSVPNVRPYELGPLRGVLRDRIEAEGASRDSHFSDWLVPIVTSGTSSSLGVFEAGSPGLGPTVVSHSGRHCPTLRRAIRDALSAGVDAGDVSRETLKWPSRLMVGKPAVRGNINASGRLA